MFVWKLLFNECLTSKLVDRPPFLFKFSELALSLAFPYACTGSALYAPGGQQVLSDRICVLLRVYKLRASLSDHMTDQGHMDSQEDMSANCYN
jgi:hypothetical protein